MDKGFHERQLKLAEKVAPVVGSKVKKGRKSNPAFINVYK